MLRNLRAPTGLAISIVLLLFPTYAVSAQRVTPGTLCKVYLQKVSFLGVCDYPVSQEGTTCTAWKGIFKKTFGITPEAAYPKFGQYIYDEIKWAKGKQVLWDQDALRIAPIPTN